MRSTPDAASAPLPANAPLVLVVDDGEVNRQVAERMLARLGYRSITADSGLLAFGTLAETRGAAILIDCYGPVAA